MVSPDEQVRIHRQVETTPLSETFAVCDAVSKLMAFISHFIPFCRHLHADRLPVKIVRESVRHRVGIQARDKSTATSSTNTDAKWGLGLLRNDIQRLGRFLRGDLYAFSDRSFKLFRYDVDAISAYYDKRPLTALLRISTVGLPFLVWLLRVRRIDPILGLSNNPDVTVRRAAQLRALLTWAGPTYLKIGQAVGNRPDLVGVIYSNELQKLVDDVGTFDSTVALEMVRKELGLEDLSDTFSSFDEHAFASASLGQVHRAALLTGENVAIKVQRPTVETDAALDVYILRRVASLAKKRFKLRSDVVGIVDEFATRLWEELDYLNEADNCERFASLYATNNDDVYVPKVFRQFTTKRVLCLEWIDGDKAPWSPKDEARRLIRVGVQCSLQQLLDKGFVHADPHGGNLLRTKDGKLCYLDFGMCVSVDEQIRNNLIAAIVRLVNRDYANLPDSFVKLGFLPKNVDTTPFVPLLTAAFGDASTSSSLSDLSFSRLTNNLSALAFATPIRIPVFFTLIIRSLTILEGFALQTDSQFKIVDEAYPYVVNRILTDDSPVFQEALKQVLIDPISGRLRWNRLSGLLKTKSSSVPDNYVESRHPRSTGWEGRRRGRVHISEERAIETPPHKQTTDGSLAGMSDRALERVLDFVLSERGAFLRQALLTEVADTADAAQLAFLKRASDATRGIIPPPEENVDFKRLENAINLVKSLRVRAPDLLTARGDINGQATGSSVKRLNLIRQRVAEATRTVAGSIVERNTRRVLRRALTTVFGPREEEA